MKVELTTIRKTLIKILMSPMLQILKITTSSCHRMASPVMAITHTVRALTEPTPMPAMIVVLVPLAGRTAYVCGLMMTTRAATRAGKEPSYRVRKCTPMSQYLWDMYVVSSYHGVTESKTHFQN